MTAWCGARTNSGYQCGEAGKFALVLNGTTRATLACRQHIANAVDELLDGHPNPEHALIKMVRTTR